jgi:AcrR family transcriptional regulator
MAANNMKQATPAVPLREACVTQALEIIGSDGLEALSLREVARRLKVSHQAPYKHFESRDHILAVAVGRAFQGFANHLERRKRHADPLEDLASLGATYVRYARQHPAHYRLIFGAPLPDPHAHPEMLAMAKVPFQILRDVIARLPRHTSGDDIDRDALFAWTAVHGLSSIFETRAGEQLGLHSRDIADVTAHTLRRIGAALMTR